MKLSRMFALTSVCCLGLFAAPVFADDAGKTCTAGSCADKVASSECAGGVCPSAGASSAVLTAMDKLPKMSFLVGETETCCSESAASMAKSADQPIHYKVGDATFETKEEAFTTLVTATEAMVADFTTPSTCSVSGSTTIAGKSCHCPMEADTMAKKVAEATQLVSMKYKVGDETCACPNSAKAMAREAGVATTFVVDGTETPCEMTARLTLARAKYKAALEALAQTSEADPVGSES